MKTDFKKMFIGKKAFTMMCATLMGAATFTSCNDDYNEAYTNEVPQCSFDGRLCGYTNVIASADNLNKDRIALSTGNVKLSNTNPDLHYTVEKDANGYFIKLNMTGNPTEFHHDEVTITSADGAKEETMYVNVDPASFCTRGSEDDNLTEKQKKACSMIGWGVNFLGEIGNHGGLQIIGLNRFFKSPELSDKVSNFLTINNNNNKVVNYYTTQESVSSITKTMEQKMGVKFNIPIKYVNVSGGFDKSHFESTTHTESRKFHMAGVDLVDFDAELNFGPLYTITTGKDGSSVGTKNIDKYEYYASMLNPDFNNYLNNNNFDGTVNEFPSTTEGMIDFLDKFGTHVVTEAQFGAYAHLSFTSNKVEDNSKVEDALAYELGVTSNKTTESEESKESTKEDKEKDGTKNVAKKICKTSVKPQAASGSFNRSTSNMDESSRQLIDLQYKCTVAGGLTVSGNNLENWTSGSVEKMVPLAYATSSKMDNISTTDEHGNRLMNQDNKSLIPIYMFCTDKTRRDILIELLTPDAEGVIPYYAMKMGLIPNTDVHREMVIADVKLVYVSTVKDLTNKMFMPMQMKDCYGVEHTYYPMVQNNEYPQTNWGDNSHIQGRGGQFAILNYTLTTNLNYWRHEDNHGTIICYYALEWSDKTNGITDIRLLGTNEATLHATEKCADNIRHDICGVECWEGASTTNGRNTDNTSATSTGSKRLYVTYGNSDTKDEDKIKAVAWHIGNPEKPWEGNIFTSSGGTEMSTDNRFTDADKEVFNNYWHNKDNVKCSYVDGGYFVRYNELKNSGQRPCHPIYSKTSIPRDMTKMINHNNSYRLNITYPIGN